MHFKFNGDNLVHTSMNTSCNMWVEIGSNVLRYPCGMHDKKNTLIITAKNKYSITKIAYLRHTCATTSTSSIQYLLV